MKKNKVMKVLMLHLLIGLCIALPAWQPANAVQLSDLSLAELEFLQACRDGRAQEAERLLRTGINPNLEMEDFNYLPIHLAAIQGHSDVVRLLLQAGANTNAADETGRTALMFAS